MFKKYMKKVLAFSLATALAFSGAQIVGVGGADVAEAAESVTFSSVKSITKMANGDFDDQYDAITADKYNDAVAGIVGIKTVVATSSDKTILGLAADGNAGAGLQYADDDQGTNQADAADLDALKTKVAASKVDYTAWGDSVDIAGNATNINMKGFKAGTAEVTIAAKDKNGEVLASQTINVTVKELVVSATVKKDGKDKTEDTYVVKATSAGADLNYTVTGNNIAAAGLTVESSDVKVAKVGAYNANTDGGFGASFAGLGSGFRVWTVAAGTATLNIYATGDVNKKSLGTLKLTVVENTNLTITYEGNTYTYDGAAWKDDKKPTISLTNANTSAQITGVSTTGSKVTYALTSGTKAVVSNDGKVDAVLLGGKVQNGLDRLTITAAADTAKGTSSCQAPVDVLITDETSKFVFVSVANSAGDALTAATTNKAYAEATLNTVTSEGKVTGTDDAVDISGAGFVDNLILSTKDKTTETLKVTSNVADNYITVTSSDTDVITVDGTTLTAKKEGYSDITVKANPDATCVQAFASVKFRVAVSGKNVNNVITVTSENPINLSKSVKTAQIVASTTDPAGKLTYTVVGKKKDDGTYDGVGTGVITVTPTGLVTYVDTATSSTEYIKITAAETKDYAAPAPVYIPVSYNGAKAKSDVTVTSTRVDIKVGGTASPGASSAAGQKLTYASDNTAVATVAEDGTITGLETGVAIITVTAEGNDDYEPGEAKVIVTVSPSEEPAVEKKANTIKVTKKTISVKAKTLKKKALTRKAFTVTSAKGTVSYTKKSGSAKLTVTKAGKIKIKKGTKKGTYKIKVAIKAAGNASYKAKTLNRTVTVKVK